jgi:hypothetical protein
MTLETLQAVKAQLKLQYDQHLLNPPVDGKDVIKWTNAIELCGARQVLEQLILQETATLAAPPGATGPVL